MTAQEIINHMESLRNEEQRQVLVRFFKTGVGEYGEGDEFLGLKVPQTRQVVRLVADDLPLDEVPHLLSSRWHEVRLCGLLVLVERFVRSSTRRLEQNADAMRRRDEVVQMYLDNADRANNWDLVDASAPKIIGHWLMLPTTLGDQRKMVDALAQSGHLWRQRISMVCTLWPTQQGDPTWCQHYAEVHLGHPHDLMHKATGWMLREMGKHCGTDTLRDFLAKHHSRMHRTTLRYTIEHLSPDERQYWLIGTNKI